MAGEDPCYSLQIGPVMGYPVLMSEAEMAKDGKLPVGTVKWRLHTARKKAFSTSAVVRLARIIHEGARASLERASHRC